MESGDVLLGLILEEHGIAAKALASLGVFHTAVREQLQERPDASPGNISSGSPPLGMSATEVIERARREAQRRGHRSVGTEHLLLGIVHDPGCMASQELVSLSVDLGRVEEQVMHLMSGQRITEPAERQRPHHGRNAHPTGRSKVAVSPGLWTADNRFEVSRDVWRRIFPRVYAHHAGEREEQFLTALREEFARHHMSPSQDVLVASARYLAAKREDEWVER